MRKKYKTRNILIGVGIFLVLGLVLYFGVLQEFTGTCYALECGDGGCNLNGIDCATNAEYEYTGQCELPNPPVKEPCTGLCPVGNWYEGKTACKGDVCFQVYKWVGNSCSSKNCAYGVCECRIIVDECENKQFGQINLEANQLVVAETFTAGSVLTTSSMRYPPVYFMGSQNPVLILDAENNTVYRDDQPYVDLAQGETLTIPDTQVWTLYYVIDNTYNLPVICSVLDVETNTCASNSIGLITLCSSGQFDASLGACVIQPESKYICPDGGRYDTVQAVCIINPPLDQVCEIGELTDIGNGNYACIYEPETIELNGTVLCIEGDYDSSRNACVVSPNIQYLCLNGDYDLSTNTCKITPEEKIICADGFTYDSSEDKCIKTPDTLIEKIGILWILLIVAIIGMLSWIAYSNKKLIKKLIK